jgi:probable rRNA maturation factor
MAIQFSSHRVRFKLSNPKKTSAWIEKVAKAEKSHIGILSYVFCSDKYLLKFNQEYLDHDTLTDIITFDYTEKGSTFLEGEIFISIERVKDNAKKLGTDFQTELHRVMVHGVLHLLGYSDKSQREKSEMRRREDKYLRVL